MRYLLALAALTLAASAQACDQQRAYVPVPTVYVARTTVQTTTIAVAEEPVYVRRQPVRRLFHRVLHPFRQRGC